MHTELTSSEHEHPSSQEVAHVALRDIFLAHLPLDTTDVVGRETELRMLEAAWHERQPRLLVLIAPDGMGKTALVSQWLRQLLARNSEEGERVLGWSFTPAAQTEVSSDEFLAYALRVCGDPDPAKGSPWHKGRRLAQLLRNRRTIVVLENLQAFQYRDGELRGRLKDPGIKALLYELRRSHPGLCLITTSEPIKDLEHHGEHQIKQIRIPALAPEDGTQLLRAGGVKGPTDALKHVVRDFDGHPLALRLLSGYLVFTHRGDIRQLDLNSPLSKIVQADKHVRRVVDGFTIWLQRKPELNILFLLGVYDQVLVGETLNAPYHNPALVALLQAPAIKGVTDYVYECSEDDWQAALTRLLNVGLLTEKTIVGDAPHAAEQAERRLPDPCRAVDCHPLVRGYFATQIRTRLPGSWREVQQRLYEYALQRAGAELPDTLDELLPLFDALRHGCAIDLYEHGFHEIYWKRIHQEERDACARRFGAPGADFAALSYFLTADGTIPLEHIPDDVYARVLDLAAQRLWEIGRLREAAEVVKKGMVFWNAREHWGNAAERANTLSRLLLPAGEVEQAVIHARLALQLYDASADRAQIVRMRIRLIRTVYVAGDLQEAEELCHALETQQDDRMLEAMLPKTPCLDAVCCDLLLHLGQYQVLRQRMRASVPANDQERTALDSAVEHFLAGKTLLFQMPSVFRPQPEHGAPAETPEDPERLLLQAKAFLDQALEVFWDSGEVEWLIHGLLVRAGVGRALHDFATAATDLEELREFIELAGMPLYLTDYHLESARLVYARHVGEHGKFSSDAAGEEYHQQMHDHVEVAEALIWRTGYHLRDVEFEDLMTRLKDAMPERVEAADIAEHQQTVNWLVPPQRKVARPARKTASIPPWPPTPIPPQPAAKPPQEQPVLPKAETPVAIVRGKVQKPKITPPAVPLEEPTPPPILEPQKPVPPPEPVRRDQDIAWVQQQERRFRPAEGYDNVYLYPGELYIAERPTIVWTLLGSCIAVVLHNERLRLGAICHAQLPEERFRDQSCSVKCEHPCYQDKPDPSRFKYATCSIRYLYDQFAARGIAGDEITVKLFGGASVLESMPDTINVGAENVKVARQVLQEYKLKIVRKDVGGRRGRTLYFYSDTGEVFMKKHRSNEER